MIQPTADDLSALDALQRAVAQALERKRRLGESAVIWQEGRVIITEGDMTAEPGEPRRPPSGTPAEDRADGAHPRPPRPG
jgi:hypothetical protein